MPEATSTIVHWHPAATVGGRAVCEASSGGVTEQPGLVTCFACRNNTLFKQALRGVEPPTPLPQRQMPKLLKYITADCTELRDIILQGLNAGTNDAEHEALTQLADHFGLTYDEDTDTYNWTGHTS